MLTAQEGLGHGYLPEQSTRRQYAPTSTGCALHSTGSVRTGHWILTAFAHCPSRTWRATLISGRLQVPLATTQRNLRISDQYPLRASFSVRSDFQERR